MPDSINSVIYFACSVLGTVGVFVYQFKSQPLSSRLIVSILFFPIFLFSLALIYRTDGVDFYNYNAIYNDPWSVGWDFGWALINYSIKNLLPLGFSEFLLLIFSVEMFLLFRICKIIDTDFSLVALIYLLHLLIVRDLSQLRVGFAIMTMLYGFFCTRGIVRWGVLGIALSIHITTAVLMCFFWVHFFLEANRFSGFKKILIVLVLASLIAVFATFLLRFSEYSDRINIYTNWDAEGYGAKVESYSTVIFIAFLLVLALINQKIEDTDFNRLAVIFSFYAIVVFFSFYSYQIFSSRLANVAISLYPFSLARSLMYLREARVSAVQNRITIKRKTFLRLLVAFVFISILFRSGNGLVVNEIVLKVSN